MTVNLKAMQYNGNFIHIHGKSSVSGTLPHINLEQLTQWGWIATSRQVGIRNDDGGIQS
jgi:hypothetical protein